MAVNLKKYFSCEDPTTIKCPHLCAISHKIFMHHKIPNGQEYKGKNAAILPLLAGGPSVAYRIKF